MTSEDHPERLVIALEPEAASIYVRKLRLYQLVPETTSPPVTQTLGRAARTSNRSSYHVTADNATTSGIPSSAENYLTKKLITNIVPGGSVAEWLACWTQAKKSPGSNRSRDAVR